MVNFQFYMYEFDFKKKFAAIFTGIFVLFSKWNASDFYVYNVRVFQIS